MGGDPSTPLAAASENESLLDQATSSSLNLSYLFRDELIGSFEHEKVNGEDGLAFGRFEEVGSRISPTFVEFEANRRKKYNAYKEVLQTYDQLRSRTESLKEAKNKILSYAPGRWIEKVSGMKLHDYDVPKTTTLLLVGPKGSGKSSLVNRMSKVFEEDNFAPERAQVSYNSSVSEGTYFLQEYMIPRSSTSFCLYDTRSLSNDCSDNFEMLKQWISKGVHHGKLIVRPSDNSSLRTRLKCKARKNVNQSKETRMVNFVIFVISGLEVLKSMIDEVGERTDYAQMIAATFNYPYLSFRDDKPVVVVTHGDLLSLPDRARIRVYLGELLGIPPAKQIFDIPENSDPMTELTIADMLHYSLEHADKNLPPKDWLAKKVPSVRVSPSTCICLLIIICIALISISIQRTINMQHKRIRRASESKAPIDWHSIRHLWLE